MLDVQFGTESDTKELMKFIRKVESERNMYHILNMLEQDPESDAINKRLVRNALFSSNYGVVIFRNEQGDTSGFIVYANDTASALRSRGILLFVEEKTCKETFIDVMREKPLPGLPEKVKIAASRQYDYLTSSCGFELESSFKMRNSKNYLYSANLYKGDPTCL